MTHGWKRRGDKPAQGRAPVPIQQGGWSPEQRFSSGTQWQQPAPPPQLQPQAEETEQGSTFLQELLETVLMAVVLFVALRAVLQSTRVISHSMVPTLQEGQYLLVNRLSYKIGSPERGDIAVFRSPEDADTILIKRVIGLPGEEIVVSGTHVYVDGQYLVETYLAAGEGSTVWGPFELGPDEYLMLGDNRNNSNDSRFFGPVPRDAIIGKAWVSIYPPGLIYDGRPALQTVAVKPTAGL